MHAAQKSAASIESGGDRETADDLRNKSSGQQQPGFCSLLHIAYY